MDDSANLCEGLKRWSYIVGFADESIGTRDNDVGAGVDISSKSCDTMGDNK